ncbi:hypothetical protein HMPREF9444_00077 [Succinatimonas hippei YIT 12066]|uniref:Uncharacterized protein n=1 Tax=Succinatimonas hippei (strain DSM 22608 / JCM 16073 / KCTC 15190 / YIT 12066) TaxID=762983 RepID=E8LHB9_SUCHY|nr:hypothetical protein HMPREF9444_00077 [Succinatimonas hippei YIT 12066]
MIVYIGMMGKILRCQQSIFSAAAISRNRYCVIYQDAIFSFLVEAKNSTQAPCSRQGS